MLHKHRKIALAGHSMKTNVHKELPYNDQAVAKYVRECKQAKKGGQRRITGVPGLSVIVKPSGFASYLVRYQVGKGRDGREMRKVVVGQHATMTLADAKSAALG